MVVVLNGPSSAGKTTLAHALRDARAPSAAAVSLDQLYPSVAHAHAKDWALFFALTHATFAAAAVFADAGFDVVVDTVFERAECWTAAREAFARHELRLVAVSAPLEVLEARERARGDRVHGQAREQAGRVLEHGSYDLVLDTAACSVDACVARMLPLFC